jgi:hypothetical protein
MAMVRVFQMSLTIPTIYTPRFRSVQLSWVHRLLAALVAIGALTVLGIASVLTPNPSGVGTHMGLHLPECGWLERFGIPCPGCGMTTSFSYMVRGNVAASFYVQPMGATLCILTAMAFWTALYIAVTGKPALRLLRFVPTGYYLLPLMFLGVAAWGWKIFIHLHGIDGWH